jgi:hypothetical protein
MSALPTLLERARSLARERPRERVEAVRVDGLRRALFEVYGEQVPLMSKVLADGRVDADERAALEEATARLARYYGLCLSFEAADGTEEALGAITASLEDQARALALAAENDPAAAQAAWERAREALDAVPLRLGTPAEPGSAAAIHEAAERVYDRATGRSKYDGDADGWLSFALRCPSESCAQIRPYRLLPRHPTHRFTCSVCGTGFLVFVATVVQADRELRLGVATHRITARGADGVAHQVIFEHALSAGAVEIAVDDLVLLTYDAAGRLKLVRDYTRSREVAVTSGGRCFVATAALGGDAPEVATLRRFRDEVLVRTGAGRAFIAAYERLGPHLAEAIVNAPRRKLAARTLVRLAASLIERTGRSS